MITERLISNQLGTIRGWHLRIHRGIGNSAYTTDKQVFHTDVGDLIALFALDNGAEGGTSRISSGPRVYNELAATRPDLIHILADEWPLDRSDLIHICRFNRRSHHSF